MEATRILPELQSALLCEEVRREANGNFFVIGIMDGIPLGQVPAVANRLCVFTRWTSGLGEFIQQVRLLAPDATELVRQEVRFQLKSPAQVASNLTLMANVKLAQPGIYQIEVLVDEVMKLRFPVPVVLIPKPEGQKAPAPAARA